jgi:hypothetical protein
MSEWDEYPRLAGLLRELCEWEKDDEGLGLEILLNLYRPRMQAPLKGLARAIHARDWRAGKRLRTPELLSVVAEDVLAGMYPTLDKGSIFSLNADLAKLFELDGFRGAGIKFSTALNEVVKDATVIHLCYQSRKGWRTYDHLVLLHRLGWDEPNRDYLLASLEVELGIDPEIARSALELAGRLTLP